MTLLRSAGLLIGPMIGGSLADPAKRWPSVFDTSFWNKYPYLLPNLTVASLELALVIVMIVGLPETGPRYRGRKDWGLRFGETVAQRFGWTTVLSPEEQQQQEQQDQQGGEETCPTNNDGQASDERTALLSTGPSSRMIHEEESAPDCAMVCPSSPRQAKKKAPTYTPQSILYIVLMISIGFHKTSSDIVTPSFLAVPRQPPSGDNPLHFSGGFGLDATTVGNMLVGQAVVGAACQLAIPHIIKRLGALPAIRLSLVLYSVSYLITPFLVLLPPNLGLLAMLVDLWLKITIVSLAYACHSIL